MPGVRVVRKQRRTAISSATKVTCTVYFFVRSQKYLSVQSNHAKFMKYLLTTVWQNDHQMKTYFPKIFWGRSPRPPSWSSKLPFIASLLIKVENEAYSDLDGAYSQSCGQPCWHYKEIIFYGGLANMSVM